MGKLTQAYIQDLLDSTVVHTTTAQVPTPHVTAFVWLGTFLLGTAVSKAVDPKNFSEELGIQYSTKDALAKAEAKLWELEGYNLYKSMQE